MSIYNERSRNVYLKINDVPVYASSVGTQLREKDGWYRREVDVIHLDDVTDTTLGSLAPGTRAVVEDEHGQRANAEVSATGLWGPRAKDETLPRSVWIALRVISPWTVV